MDFDVNSLKDLFKLANDSAAALANFWTAFTLAAGGSIYLWKNHKAHQRIASGILGGHSCVYGDTAYLPTGKINKSTGNEIYQQRIRTIDNRMPLGDIFHPDVSRRFLKYIDKAAKLCTPEKPIVFQHLHEVIHPKKYNKTIDMMSRAWVSYFSEISTPGNIPQTLNPKSREIEEEATGFPLLVYESDTKYKRYRVFWVNPEYINLKNLPDEADTIFSSPHHSQRLMTNKIIAEQLEKNPWISKMFRVNVPTGKKVFIPMPETLAT